MDEKNGRTIHEVVEDMQPGFDRVLEPMRELERMLDVAQYSTRRTMARHPSLQKPNYTGDGREMNVVAFDVMMIAAVLHRLRGRLRLVIEDSPGLEEIATALDAYTDPAEVVLGVEVVGERVLALMDAVAEVERLAEEVVDKTLPGAIKDKLKVGAEAFKAKENGRRMDK